MDNLETFLSTTLGEYVGMDGAELLEEDPTMAEILARSSALTNSVDLMEAFAKTANRLRKEHQIRVSLPTMPLDTRISTVLDALKKQVADKSASEDAA